MYINKNKDPKRASLLNEQKAPSSEEKLKRKAQNDKP